MDELLCLFGVNAGEVEHAPTRPQDPVQVFPENPPDIARNDNQIREIRSVRKPGQVAESMNDHAGSVKIGSQQAFTVFCDIGRPAKGADNMQVRLRGQGRRQPAVWFANDQGVAARYAGFLNDIGRGLSFLLRDGYGSGAFFHTLRRNTRGGAAPKTDHGALVGSGYQTIAGNGYSTHLSFNCGTPCLLSTRYIKGRNGIAAAGQ